MLPNVVLVLETFPFPGTSSAGPPDPGIAAKTSRRKSDLLVINTASSSSVTVSLFFSKKPSMSYETAMA